MAREWPTFTTVSFTAVQESQSSATGGTLVCLEHHGEWPELDIGFWENPAALALSQIHAEVSDRIESDESHAADLRFFPLHETERSWAFSLSWHSLSANTDIVVPSCTGRRNTPFETSKMKTWLFSCQWQRWTFTARLDGWERYICPAEIRR